MNSMQKELNTLYEKSPEKLKKKETVMHYLESLDDPTWFKTEKQALLFMKDLENSSGVRHVLEYRNDGCAVVPFFIQDADGENIEINDIIYDCDNQAYQIQQFSRIENTAWEAVAENEKGKRSITKDTGCEYRHSLWTESQLKKHKREYYLHHISSKMIEWVSYNSTEIIKVVIGITITAMAVILGYKEYTNPTRTETSNVPIITNYPCTISELEAKERKINDSNGTYASTRTYYFLTITNPEWGYDIQFSCTEDLWKILDEGEKVTLIQKESNAPLFYALSGETKRYTYTIKGQPVTNFQKIDHDVIREEDFLYDDN